MSKANNLTDFLTNVADAIREKNGSTAKINPQNFYSEIMNIGGSISAETVEIDLGDKVTFEIENSAQLILVPLRVSTGTSVILTKYDGTKISVDLNATPFCGIYCFDNSLSVVNLGFIYNSSTNKEVYDIRSITITNNGSSSSISYVVIRGGYEY